MNLPNLKMKNRLTILILSFVLFISNNVLSQNKNKISKLQINCLLENFQLFNVKKDIDSLINSSKKNYSTFISNFYNNQDSQVMHVDYKNTNDPVTATTPIGGNIDLMIRYNVPNKKIT